MNVIKGGAAAQDGGRTQFIVTPQLKEKLHWPLTEIGVRADLANSLAEGRQINRVGDILRWEWADIPIDVQDALRSHGFSVSGCTVVWLEQRVLTIRMQELLKCSPEEIGIDLRNCNALEEQRLVHTVDDLLKLGLGDLDGIANLGDKGKEQILKCLDNYGFVRGPNIVWIDEQDTAEFQLKQLKKTNTADDDDDDEWPDDLTDDDFGSLDDDDDDDDDEDWEDDEDDDDDLAEVEEGVT